MKRRLYIVAVLSLGVMISSPVWASDDFETAPNPKTKNAERIIKTLKKMDLYDPSMKETLMFLDERIEDRKLVLIQEEIVGFNAVLQYDMHGFDSENIQLKFENADYPGYKFVATPEGTMLSYSVKF